MDYSLKVYILWHIYTPGKGSLSTPHDYSYTFSKNVSHITNVNHVGSCVVTEYIYIYYVFLFHLFHYFYI